MKVLVIGGSGFLGYHLVDSLISSGYNVRVLDCIESAAFINGPQVQSFKKNLEKYLETNL